MYEKIATPNTSITDVINLSASLLGLKSPNPVVDKEVKAKYKLINVTLASLSYSRP